jgi:hypothetical protein
MHCNCISVHLVVCVGKIMYMDITYHVYTYHVYTYHVYGYYISCIYISCIMLQLIDYLLFLRIRMFRLENSVTILSWRNTWRNSFQNFKDCFLLYFNETVQLYYAKYFYCLYLLLLLLL